MSAALHAPNAKRGFLRLRGVEQAESLRFGDRLCTSHRAQFAQDRGDVLFDCALREEEPLGDRGVAEAFTEKPQNFEFAGR